jgi:hypothetical protein
MQCTFEVTDLQGFVGIQGVHVFCDGFVTPGDGGAGVFWWNATITGVVSDNVNTVVPNGVIIGAWIRLGYLKISTPYQYVVPTTGFVINMSTGVSDLLLNPAGTLASGTVVLPIPQQDGFVVTISTTQTISAITISGTVGTTVINAPTSLAGGSSVTFQYVQSIQTWFNIGQSGKGVVSSVAPGAGISSTLAAGGVTPITSTGTLYLDASYLRDYLAGLTTSNDGTSPNTVLDISAGVCVDSANAYLIKLATITKSTSGAWAAGNGNGGMGNGLSVGSSTWYYVFAIINAGAPDVYFDTSLTAVNQPAGTTAYRRIGSFKTDSSAHILAFVQYGDVYVWAAPVTEGPFTVGTTASTASLLGVPTGIVVTLNATVGYSDPVSGSGYFVASSLAANDVAASVNYAQITSVEGSFSGTTSIAIQTNTSAQIRLRTNTAGSTVNMTTTGWIDNRGRFS